MAALTAARVPLIVSVALFLSGYDGYAGVFLAVAAAAAVNLIPLGAAE